MYNYIFSKNCWVNDFIDDTTGQTISLIHNPKFDPPIPEDIVIRIAKKEFGDKYENFSKITRPIVGFPDLLIASVKGGSRISIQMLYDFGTEKFIIRPSNQSSKKMTLEQKKTLIKMIHEI